MATDQQEIFMLNFELSVVQQIAILAIQLGVIIFAAKFCGDLAKKFKKATKNAEQGTKHPALRIFYISKL